MNTVKTIEKISQSNEFSLSCPVSFQKYPHVLLAHGGGGKLMHQLIEEVFLSVFDNANLNQRHDSAVLNPGQGQIAFTTDSYVVQPLFFPGGNIGTLAINGTVNDLAMSGARPLYLSCGFILEEGLAMEDLWRIVQSMRQAAMKAKVQIVTGDTKVVDKGKGDGVFINTAGIGIMEYKQKISPQMVQEGDALIVNGDLGRHGIAIMATREGLSFETKIESDTIPLAGVIQDLISEGIEIHCLRDLTRGGLASALNEIALAASVEINIDEPQIPVREDVRGACEMLGLDPLYVANEGRFIAFIPEKDVKKALSVMKSSPAGREAAIIGKVTRKSSALVTMTSAIGVSRILDMIIGEQLPRIC